MKKFKCFIAAILVICVAVCLGVFAAGCTDKDHFVVTIEKPDGSAAVGVSVWLCATNGNEQCLTAVKTDSDGVASIDITSCEGATTYSLHFTDLPSGCAVDGVDSKGYLYFDTAEVGYSVTIKLKEQASANLPEPDLSNLISIRLANASAQQEVTPNIEVDGYYQLRSTTEFTIEGEGYSLTDGYITVLIYLESGDSFKIGTTSSDELEFSVAIIPPYDGTNNAAGSVTTDGKEKPHTVSAGTAVVLNLEANEKVNFNNGDTLGGNGTTSNIIVSGANISATYREKHFENSFAVAANTLFSVSRADGAAGVLALSCTSPVVTTTVGVGTEEEFEIDLIESSTGTVAWLTEEFFVAFTVAEAGSYKITVTSDFANDLIEITQVGSNTHYPNKTASSTNAGNSYFFTCALNAGTTYRAFLTTSANFSAFDDGDSITYTVLIEKI